MEALSADMVPSVELAGDWEDLFKKEVRGVLSGLLVSYMKGHRWFGGKARTVRTAAIQDTFRMPYDRSGACFVFIRVEYIDGEPETYLLPLALASGEQARGTLDNAAQFGIARLVAKEGDSSKVAVLYEALADKGFCNAFLEAIARRRHFKAENGEVVAQPTREMRKFLELGERSLEPSILKAEQSNSSIVYGNRLLLKIFRRLDQGTNPDLELERFLTEKASFSHVPLLAGTLEYQTNAGETITLAMVLEFVPNTQDGWQYTLDSLISYFERALAKQPGANMTPVPRKAILALLGEDTPALARELLGPYLELARLLGQRTAELHLALTGDAEDPDFAPEPFSDPYRRAVYHGMLGLTDRALELLRQHLGDLSREAQDLAKEVLRLEECLRSRFQTLNTLKVTAMRARYHGDYHLGQVLYTGKDFVIIDFEGEPTRPLNERRTKSSPLRDVAGMLRSFHYASCASLFNKAPGVRPEDLASLRDWASFWQLWVSTVFLKAYLEVAAQGSFLPKTQGELQVLLDVYLMEKAIYELSYELNNRPEWVSIPLQGILQLLESSE